MHKRRKFQISISAILLLTAAVAYFTARATAGWGLTTLAVSSILFIELIVFSCCIEVLVRNVPRSIHRTQRANCHRDDGTWSSRRARIEEVSRERVRVDLMKAFVIVAIASNIAGLFIHAEVIPLPVAIEAMSSFRLDQSKWKSELRDDEVRLGNWMQRKGSPVQATKRKRMLWNSWPLFVAGAALWVSCCCVFVAFAYRHSVSELAASVKFRAEQYRLQALHNTVGHDDFAKAYGRNRRPKGRRRAETASKSRESATISPSDG